MHTQGPRQKYGNWLIGNKGHGHFVINFPGTPTEPQLLLRSDSMVFRVGKHGRAGNGWRHAGINANNMQLGNWIMGAKDDRHFVISQIKTAICQFLIRNDGYLFYHPKAGEAPAAWHSIDIHTCICVTYTSIHR